MNTEEKEVWKDIPGFEGRFKVSNLGRVKSLKRKKLPEDVIRTFEVSDKGYCKIKLINSKGKERKFRVHRLVILAFEGFQEGLVVDHINNIKTDNRLVNLQQITNRENCTKDRKGGTSKYTGVSKHSSADKWVSNIFANGKPIPLGYFDTELEAHYTYQKALKEILNNKPVTTRYKAKEFSSKYPGICKQRNRWRAKHKKEYIGVFTTELEAYDARESYIRMQESTTT